MYGNASTSGRHDPNGDSSSTSLWDLDTTFGHRVSQRPSIYCRCTGTEDRNACCREPLIDIHSRVVKALSPDPAWHQKSHLPPHKGTTASPLLCLPR